MITIIVDSNEASQTPTVFSELQKGFPGTEITISKLGYGDILIVTEGKVMAIERKAPHDFLASIGDGRLFDQVERMNANTQYSFILIDGAITFNHDDMAVIKGKPTNWRGSSVRSAMMAVQLGGSVLLNTVNYAGIANIVHEIIGYVVKPDHAQKAKKNRAVTFPPCDGRVDILSQFEGVGHKRATSILEWVGKNDKLGRLCDAISYASLMNLIHEDSHPEGWGKGTVDKFRASLGLKPNEFIDIVKENNDGNEI